MFGKTVFLNSNFTTGDGYLRNINIISRNKNFHDSYFLKFCRFNQGRVFYEKRELTDQDILKSLEETKPISVVIGERIQALREWAKDHARYASLRAKTDKIEDTGRWGSIKPPDSK